MSTISDMEEKMANNAEDIIKTCRDLKSKKLDLCRKKLHDIPSSIFELNHLEFLYLEGNSLHSLPDELFISLPKLKWLDLRKNKLRSLPASIGKLRFLRSLLLEGNNLQKLPLELGLLKSLSGLHVAENPLEFPPPSVIEQGTLEILAYLRKHLDEKLKQFDQDEAGEIESGDQDSQGAFEDYEVLQPRLQQARRNSDPLTRRASDREDSSPFRVVTSALSSPASRARRNHEIAKRIQTRLLKDADQMQQRISKPESFKSAMEKARAKPLKPLKAAHKTTQFNDRVEMKMQEEMKMAEKRMKNSKIDAELQKLKNKQQLNDWRKETQKMQRQKNTIARKRGIKKEAIKMPYGTENEVAAPATKHGEKVQQALHDKLSIEKLKRDREIIDRIEEHVRKMRLETSARKKMNPTEQVNEAKKNLEEALSLQRQLEEQRAVEYRLRAFTGDAYAPPSHALPSSKGPRL